MKTAKETTSAEVAGEPKQAEEAWSQRWHWVEPTVWTKRMLEALERGVKGGKWFALIDKIIQQMNPVLRGWYGYFCHAVDWSLEQIDGWVRGRLRAILRKRRGGRGRGRGTDHQRWSNAYFARHGLFALHEAQRAAIQSHR